MKLKALSSLFNASSPLPRAYIFYGKAPFVTLQTRLLEAFLFSCYPKLQVKSLDEVEGRPSSLSLFEPPASEATLYCVKKLPKDLQLLRRKSLDFFIFCPSSFNQKSSFFQKYASRPDLVFVACYEASFGDLSSLLSHLKPSLSASSLAFLASYYEMFPAAVGDFLQKLPYLPENVCQETLQLLLTQTPSDKAHPLLVDDFFGPFRPFQRRLLTTSFNKADFIPFSRNFMQACQKLHQVLLLIKAGRSFRTALYAVRYPLFFSKEAFLSAHLKTVKDQALLDFYTAFLGFEHDLMRGLFQPSAVWNTLLDGHQKLFGGYERKADSL